MLRGGKVNQNLNRWLNSILKNGNKAAIFAIAKKNNRLSSCSKKYYAMHFARLFVLFLLVFSINSLAAQERTYQVGCIGFYNVENLFDTINNPLTNDVEFTPEGSKNYNTKIYLDKLDKLAQVISEIGTEMTPDGVSILGLAEVENRKVMEDLAAHPLIADRNYKIVHFDSPDGRGIDVALYYQPKYFTVLESRPITMMANEDGSPRKTREILYVSGLFDGDLIHILVNHWPSRRGGERATQPLRNAAAEINKQMIDSLVALDPNAKIIVMGDFNDDPTSPSMRKVLQAKAKPEQVKPGGLFNPSFDLYKKGYGTLAYQDAWSLFDQVVVSYGWLDKQQQGYFFHKFVVYNPRYMRQSTGRFKGYPLRTFVGDTYMGGYSDHFPSYVFLLKAQI